MRGVTAGRAGGLGGVRGVWGGEGEKVEGGTSLKMGEGRRSSQHPRGAMGTEKNLESSLFLLMCTAVIFWLKYQQLLTDIHLELNFHSKPYNLTLFC